MNYALNINEAEGREKVSLSTRNLTPTLREVYDLLGWKSTVALVKRYGGTHIRVPRRYREGHELNDVLGSEAAGRFVWHFAGTTLYIAKMDSAPRVERDNEIRKRYDGGSSAAQLAREYDLSERWIWSILKKL